MRRLTRVLSCMLLAFAAQSQTPAKFHVIVKVKDQSGAPIPESTVAIFTNGDRVATTKTAPDGAAPFDLPKGLYELSAMCPGFMSNKQTFTISDKAEQFFGVALQVGSGRGPVRVDNPVDRLELWGPPLDNLWIEQGNASRLHRRRQSIRSRRSP
jgi:Carboxypeptidase regulatory-like domain